MKGTQTASSTSVLSVLEECVNEISRLRTQRQAFKDAMEYGDILQDLLGEYSRRIGRTYNSIVAFDISWQTSGGCMNFKYRGLYGGRVLKSRQLGSYLFKVNIGHTVVQLENGRTDGRDTFSALKSYDETE